MGVQSDYYIQKADDLHERERDIKAARGKILDVKGNVLADNRTVCTISVIHSQIKEPEKVIRVLKEQLSMDEETVRKKVEKVSSIERIKTNVDKTIGDAIREYALDGVKVDEDYRRYYPYGSLALGGFVAGVAYAMQMPLFIILVGLIYLIEVLSVMIQVSYFKATHGKRIFKMAPIHHHFELCGWSETRVVAVFSVVTAIMCLIALLAL